MQINKKNNPNNNVSGFLVPSDKARSFYGNGHPVKPLKLVGWGGNFVLSLQLFAVVKALRIIED